MPSSQHPVVTAVNVLLEPDRTMVARAEAANDRLRTGYSEGFSLDAAHRPHVTLVQGYFPTVRLDEVHAAVRDVVDAAPIASWSLTAVGYYYLPWQDLGVAGIVITPTAEMTELQRRLLDAVDPFAAATGTSEAYATTPDDPEINQVTMDYVGAFAQAAAGQNFYPHVTVGIGHQDDLDAMLAEPFDEFTFAAASAAAYQLGNFGTAAKLLHRWELHA